MPTGGAREHKVEEGGKDERKKWKENGREIKLFNVPTSSHKPKMAHYV